MTMDPTAIPLSGRALEEYGAARIRNEAFDQIRILWERRKVEGWTQKRLADAIGRDPGWVSRNLSAPGNWTVRTIGAFTQGLSAEATVIISPLEDAVDNPSNYDAYDEYDLKDNTKNRPARLLWTQENRSIQFPLQRPISIEVTKREEPYQLRAGD
jgi:transcriptional regulator with XRE-family HTH domain